jgi:uncharacterized protein YycO
MTCTQQSGLEVSLAQGEHCLTFADLQAGDILLCCPQTPDRLQQSIADATASPYTHAAIVLGNGEIGEAVFPDGVVRSPVESALDGAAHVGVLRSQMIFTPKRVKKLNEFIDAVVESGERYNLRDARNWENNKNEFLAGQMEHIARHYGEFKLSDEMAKAAYMCSSLIVACFAAVGIIDEKAQCAFPPPTFAPANLHDGTTFGWTLGYLVPEGSSVPATDPLRMIMQWKDAK